MLWLDALSIFERGSSLIALEEAGSSKVSPMWRSPRWAKNKGGEREDGSEKQEDEA